jgi:hypothetical protein
LIPRVGGLGEDECVVQVKRQSGGRLRGGLGLGRGLGLGLGLGWGWGLGVGRAHGACGLAVDKQVSMLARRRIQMRDELIQVQAKVLHLFGELYIES